MGCPVLAWLLVALVAGPVLAADGVPAPTAQAATGVAIEGPLVGLQVTLDDQPVAPDATGFVAAEPARDHRLVVRVPLYVPFVLRFSVAPGEVRSVRPRLYRETTLGPRSGSLAPTQVREAPGYAARHWPSLTALGVGVAGLATGAMFHLLAERDWARIDDAERDDDGAVSGLTEREAWHLADRARDRELGGWIGFGLGGGMLLTSAVLLVLEPFGDDADVVLAPSPGGVVLTGAW